MTAKAAHGPLTWLVVTKRVDNRTNVRERRQASLHGPMGPTG